MRDTVLASPFVGRDGTPPDCRSADLVAKRKDSVLLDSQRRFRYGPTETANGDQTRRLEYRTGGFGAAATAQDDAEDRITATGSKTSKNYEETEDLTGEDEVTVDVGAGDDGYQFDPPAIRIDQDATVVWEWTGEGGGHNVVHVPEDEEELEIEDATGADEPVFETDITDEEGFTFEHQFEDTGTYPYVCEPHRQQGMKERSSSNRSDLFRARGRTASAR